MRNEYRIVEEITYIKIVRCRIEYECLIDTNDLPLVQKIESKFYLTRGGYVLADNIYLSRLIMGVVNTPSVVVDHKYGDTLDNRRNELRVTNQVVNGLNRQNININNTSGYPNVSWDKYNEKWRASVKLDGVLKYLGVYSNIEEAARIAREYKEGAILAKTL